MVWILLVLMLVGPRWEGTVPPEAMGSWVLVGPEGEALAAIRVTFVDRFGRKVFVGEIKGRRWVYSNLRVAQLDLERRLGL